MKKSLTTFVSKVGLYIVPLSHNGCELVRTHFYVVLLSVVSAIAVVLLYPTTLITPITIHIKATRVLKKKSSIQNRI